ncbi:hypothetical protein V5F53_14685 [Xanthobacter sp. V4C-4]|uniref:bestrophin-like domain n=1 Tax=Xanthobacter cornucopiae TaxID=3119924 RepID=UPI003727F8E3
MQALLVGGLVFISLFAGVCGGMWGARRLKEQHLSKETQEAVKLGVGMVAAMSSLILGLMTASVKGNFDATAKDVQQFATDLITVDVSLRTYGPAANDARQALIAYTRHALAETWPGESAGRSRVQSASSEILLEAVGHQIRILAPATPVQAELRAEALERYKTVTSLRWTVVGEAITSVPPVFIAVLIVWLTLIFISFGLFAPVNAVSVVMFFLCSLSLAGALFLILEMSGPFDGIIQIPSSAMRHALDQMRR